MLPRRVLAEFIGTALLLIAVVGSGIAAQRLSPDDTGLQLLENAAATAAALVAIILAVGPVSGAHLNPVVTLADRLFGGLDTGTAGAYVGAQVAGGTLGTVVANLMFDLPAVEWSTTDRWGGHLWLAEVVATFGLLLVVFGVVRSGRSSVAPYAVGAYIAGAYFFTSSTSFANPAVTLARTLSDTFAGIEPGSVLPFVLAQLAGAGVAVASVRVLYPQVAESAADVVVPHGAEPVLSPNGRSADPSRTIDDPRRLVPDLHSMTPDQELALKTAARNLAATFDGVFATETIELFLVTSYEQFADRARFTHFLPLMAERFAKQRLQALARVEGKVAGGVPVVLFLCVHNAGRSQMALGWFNHLAGERAVAWSGGSEPGIEVNPAAVAAMAEVGIDIAQEFPKPWTEEIVQAADVVVTMGCGDACPLFPGKRYEDWELADPDGMGVEAVRPIRDEIGRRVRELLDELLPVA